MFLKGKGVGLIVNISWYEFFIGNVICYVVEGKLIFIVNICIKSFFYIL